MTYEELCSFEVLYKAYLEARKGKRSKSKTIEYEAQALACTEKLSRKLAVCNVRQPDGSIRQQIRYVPSKFEVFAVYEPKRRMVHAPAFVDKVVLHALVDNILYDALTKSFIRDSHASQTGKGTDDGLMRLKTHMVDYYRREGHGADGWVLKGDVRHFFASIDHRKLKRKLKAVLDKRGVDPRVYELLCIYIDVMEDGLPLGYQTSQLFALMFLDEFDHIIKEKYRIKYYGRYMDDFYFICSDKKKLQCILRDVRALMDSYGLELNQKTAIFMVVGLVVTALAAVRLGYGLVVAKTVYKWIVNAEEKFGAGAGAEKKAHVIAVLRGYTPDWLDWAINERTLDWIVQLVFDFTKKKLEDYMAKKSVETTTVARFGKAGEDKRND